MTTQELNAITVADDLVEFLENRPSHLACVHSVFPHALNLLLPEDQLITLTSQDDPTPMGLTVESGLSFTEFLKAGAQVVLDVDRFTWVNGLLTVSLREAEVWETSSVMPLEVRSAEDLAQIKLHLFRWLSKQPSEGLLPLLPRLTRQSIDLKPAIGNIYSRYIANDLEAFTYAINASYWQRALLLADKLVGFGMGSTPSCDDFLAAYLVVLAIADASCPGQYPWIREFTQTIVRKAKNRTTLISANMIRHGADGKTSQSHQQLIQTCLYDTNGELELLADQVMKHGATSGGDFLLGLICALEWVQNTMMDISKEGERARVGIKQPQPVPGI